MSFVAAGVAVGVGVGGAGLYMASEGNSQVAAGQQEALEFQKQQAALQQQQNQVNATRQQRQMIREGIVARANALSNSTNQGSQLGSGLEGVMGTASAQVAANVGAVGQNLAFGAKQLELKQGEFEGLQKAAAGASMAAMGNSLMSLGGGLIKNSGEIVRVGTNVASRLFA